MSGRERSFGIVGAGCAGLSLAVEILDRLPEARVTIVEPRTEFPRDRTWCWWQVEPTRWDHLATHRWSAWRAHAPQRSVEHRTDRHPYLHLPSDRFHAAAIDLVQRSGRCRLEAGTRARGVDERSGGAWIDTDAGSLGPFETVFDGRPPARSGDGLEQRFLGYELRTERPLFDPATVELMDFRVDQSAGPHFMYVLPFGPDHALVESTGLLAPGAAEPDRTAAIRAWMAERGGDGFVIERTEAGVIPMRVIDPPHGSIGRVCRIGTAAGAVKPATGYAFAGIQRSARRLASRLASGPHPAHPRSRHRAADAMDRLMIDLLREQPALAPRVLVSVLRGLGADRTARFLGDHGGAGDLLAAIRATPAGPMLGHLAGRVARRSPSVAALGRPADCPAGGAA
jgi:lycopene beta-cyclase